VLDLVGPCSSRSDTNFTLAYSRSITLWRRCITVDVGGDQRRPAERARSLLKSLVMRSWPSTLLTGFMVLGSTRTALAEEEPDLFPTSWPSSPAFRVNLAATGTYGSYDRAVTTPRSETGVNLGGELRVHPYSISGALLAFESGSGLGLFGPTLTTFDAAYSFRAFAPKKLEGATLALYLDVGPSIGFVSVPQGFHHDLGGRVGASLDLQVWNLTLGPELVYHGGDPVDGKGLTQWESSLAFGFKLGVAFDVARASRTDAATGTIL
jgi:hypothetical protein